jgi:sulfite exporter TauE/SafE
MFELWPAFILGLAGSLHCAGMCGPLALAVPHARGVGSAFVLSRVAYNAGRLATYGLLGAVFGVVGMTFALAGLQRWASIGAGAAIIIGLLTSTRGTMNVTISKFVLRIRSKLGVLLRQRTLSSAFLFGMLNGLLPCGLVYVACAGAVAAGGWVGGMAYLLTFGLGTVPMMLSIGLMAKLMRAGTRLRLQKMVPVCLVVLGFSLVLRGMSLGIPYVSPKLSDQGVHCPACNDAEPAGEPRAPRGQ